MPLTITSTGKFRKNSKNFDSDGIAKLKEQIKANPLGGYAFQGGLKGIREIKFNRSPECRFLYFYDANCKENSKCKYSNKIDDHNKDEIDNCTGYLVYIDINTREYFGNYRKLKLKDLI